MTFASSLNNNFNISFGIGSFGSVIFKVNSSYIYTFDELSRHVTARFADHEVAGKKPVSEKTGEELDEITFNIQLNNSYSKPELELLKLNKMLSSGAAHRLIIGTRNLGKFTLREFEENLTHVGANGTLLFVDLSVTLVEYIDSFPNNAKTAQREDEAMRGRTGKGGPERLPGAPPASKDRSMTPLHSSPDSEDGNDER